MSIIVFVSLHELIAIQFDEHGEPWALERRALVDDGEVDTETMMEAVTMVSEAFRDCRNQARRVRVRHQFQDLAGEPLIANKRYLRMERAVVKQLHEHRYYQQFTESVEDIPSQDAESDIRQQANQDNQQGNATEQEEEYHVTRNEDDDYLEWDNEVDDITDDSDDSSEDPPPRRLPTLEDLLAE